MYGGNLGKPQDVPFIISCLRQSEALADAYFVIVGSGTEKFLLERYVEQEKPLHVKLLDHLPKNEYDRMIACCDVGLIFLDHRFTIPNFPSRLLSYMQAGLPVLACTDSNTDIGKIIVEGEFGWWCKSDDVEKFVQIVKNITKIDYSAMSENSKEFLIKHYSNEIGFDCINRRVNNPKLNNYKVR